MESATLRAATCAAPSLSAPTTRTCATLVVPSASSTICSASDVQTSLSAAVNDASEGSAARPLASTSTVSLVEVQPSTVMTLNETSTAARRAAVQHLGRRDGVGGAQRQHRGHVRRQHGRALGHGADGEPGPLARMPSWARCRWS